jgi:hypothetical protein
MKFSYLSLLLFPCHSLLRKSISSTRFLSKQANLYNSDTGSTSFEFSSSSSSSSYPYEDNPNTRESDVIFSSSFEVSSTTTSSTSSTTNPKKTSIYEFISPQPDLFYINLAYDHLSTNSLKAVEALPSIKFLKTDLFLTKWWYTIKKWNLLYDELKTIDDCINDCTDDENDPKKHYSKRNVVLLNELNQLCSSYHARILCIGDVHGCIDELVDLLKEMKYRPGDTIVFLGDLVAKGPNSTSVVRLAMDLNALSVRGNHDHEVIRQGEGINEGELKE